VIDTIIEISTYIFIAILLGLVFGWLITSLLLKEKYENDLQRLSKQRATSSTSDKESIENQSELGVKQTTQTAQVNAPKETLEECQKRLHGKDELIASLTTKLSHAEEKQREIEKRYEEEIDAFMFERIDITQKYKALLEKFNALKAKQEGVKEGRSWFSKLFASSSAS
jgi:uncharacterized membrane protein YciS (DUF1049 family)